MDDATQEVFAVVHRRFASVDDPAAPVAWLDGIARRVASRYRRTSWRRRRKHREAANMAPGSDPRRWDALITLEQALSRLDPEVRTVYRLVEIEGRSAGDVARVLGVRRPTVYGRLARAREQMSGTFEELGVASSRRPKGRRLFLFAAPLQRVVTAVASHTWLHGFVIGAASTAIVLALALPHLGFAGEAPPAPEAPASQADPKPAVADRRRSKAPEAAYAESPVSDAQLVGPPAPSPSPSSTSRHEPGKRAASRSADAPPPAKPPTTSALAAEVKLLRSARAALAAGKPAAALAAVNRHADRFRDGELADARAAAKIEALCALGRSGDAQRAARTLRSKIGASPLLPTRDLCNERSAKRNDDGD